MAAFNFPNSPSTNDLHTENGVTFKWNGTKWLRVGNSYSDISTLNVSGIGTFGGKVGIADSIVHTGNENTSIRFPSTSELTVETGGVERFRIDSIGRVGVGTAHPKTSFEVRDAKANVVIAKDGLTIKQNNDIATSYDLLQIGAGGALASYSVATVTADTQFIHNAYRHSGNNWKYRYADSAARIRMNAPQGAIIFDSATAGSADADITWSEKLRIDSAGRVLMGTTTEGNAGSDDLTIATSGSTGITLRSGTSSNGNLYFSDGTSGDDEYRGSIQYQHANNALVFATNAVERLTIDTSGNIKVPDGGKFVAGTGNDLAIYHDGHSRIKTDSSATGNLVIDSNNDINLRVNNSEMSIHCKENGAVELYYDNAVRLQTTSGGVGVTGSINAGGGTFGDYNVETNRTSGSSKGFYAKRGGVTCSVLSNHGTGPEGKMELYNNGTMNYSAHGTAGTLALNGYIRFGISNGAGNQLDDYEEGSFTPQPWSAAGSISYSHAGDARQGRYTKIGNLVYFVIRLQLSSVSTANGQAFIIGLPFTASNRTGGVDFCHAFNINFYEGIGGLGGDTSITGRVAGGQSYILLQKKGDGSSASSYSANDWSGNWSIYGSGCYHTDS